VATLTDVERSLSQPHLAALRRAYLQLEKQSFATKLADYAGQPVDRVMRTIPRVATRRLNRAIEVAMLRALDLAIRSIDLTATRPPANKAAAFAAGINGGLSGFFGAAALPLELPFTTTLMLRAVADTARHYGEDLSRLESRLACVEVFGLGSGAQNQLQVGYYATRALLSKLSGEASAYLIERGALGVSAPVVNSVISELAARFGVIVSERFAASALPVLGAIGGATVNVIFMTHFQRVAQGHFIIRRLERLYGAALVRRRYEALSAEGNDA
jgi:hypothetical protein